MFAHSRDPHPAIKLWCQVPFTKPKTTFQFEMYCMQCLWKSKYIKSRTFNDKNRWISKKLLQHLATRGTYSPGYWRCDEAWREQTLVHPPVMCQQRLIYCTWELNVMKKTSKFRATGLCEGNPPVTGRFPSQRASNVENMSICWRHHGSLASDYLNGPRPGDFHPIMALLHQELYPMNSTNAKCAPVAI